MFSKRTGRTIPVYLVDEEIYAKCPTVIISTVDKFARFTMGQNRLVCCLVKQQMLLEMWTYRSR